MAATSRLTASALIGVLMVLGDSAVARAQRPTVALPADAPPESTGSVGGEVRNERGQAVSGALVSFVGATITVAVTDDRGRFDASALLPGPYQVRAHASGYVAPKHRLVQVRSGIRTSSSFFMQRDETAADGAASPKSATLPAILAAGVGIDEVPQPDAERPPPDAQPPAEASPIEQTEVGWRLRHLRRGILRELSLPGSLMGADDAAEAFAAFAGAAGRAMSSSARLATSLLADAPLSGQFQLLTTNSFDAPQQLLSGLAVARGIAYVKVGAPVGERADWTVRGAITQADIASWFVGGTYKTRISDRRAYDLGLSYSTQQYVGGNPLALRDFSDGTRNVANVYGFESLTLTPAVAVSYGAEYARYDYLAQRDLISPRASLSVGSPEGTRLLVSVSSRADAPGAGEFLPPGENGLWLPPQRTFSSVRPGAPLRPERTTQIEAGLERALGGTTVFIRGFRQHVDDQVLTVFGLDSPGYPGSRIGHYVVGTAGDADALGGSVSVQSSLGSRIRGTVGYSVAVAHMMPDADLGYIAWGASPPMLRRTERLHDVSTSIAADVPETATRLLVFYRVGNGYGMVREDGDGLSGLDSRFDVQVRQALPFLNFTNARWEMLVAIRNFFRDPEAEQSVYDELLAVRAPKRLVGGVSLHF